MPEGFFTWATDWFDAGNAYWETVPLTTKGFLGVMAVFFFAAVKLHRHDDWMARLQGASRSESDKIIELLGLLVRTAFEIAYVLAAILLFLLITYR